MELTRELTVADIEGGAVLERLEIGLQEVLKDCADVNKIPDSVREVSCKIKIKPDVERMVLMIGIETDTKLGKQYPVIAKAFLDESTGKVFEYAAKQQDMFEPGKMTVIGGSRE
jgi:hypothetical protein